MLLISLFRREDARSQSGEDKMSSTQSLPAKPVVRQVSSDSGLETSDKSTTSTTQPTTTSTSQPIIIRETDIIGVDQEPAPLSTSLSSLGMTRDLSTSISSASDLSPMQETRDFRRQTSMSSSSSSVMDTSMSISVTSDSGADELALDIDHALEEVMAGLKSLEMQQKSDKRMSLPVVKLKQTPKHTPDLVLDLPDGSNTPPSHDSSEPDSPTTAAETFAKSNQGTLKKGMSTIANAIAVVPVVTMPGISFQRSTSPSNRRSISSEPGDLARETSGQQSHLSSFGSSFKRNHQNSMPSIHPAHMDNISGGTRIGKADVIDSNPANITTSPSMLRKLSPVPNTTPPPVAQKPKVPLKVKPPVMKKPTKPDSPPSVTATGSPQPIDTAPQP